MPNTKNEDAASGSLKKIEIHEKIPKLEKIEKLEHKEKPEKFEHKEKPEKFEHKEKPEKHEHKEKPEKHEHKEKLEKLELREKVIFEGNVKDQVEGVVLPGGDDPIQARLAALETTVNNLTHFITSGQRPDLTQGALAAEVDLKKKG